MKTTQKGDEVSIRGDDIPYGAENIAYLGMRYLWSALAPVPAAIVNTVVGEDVVGQPTNPLKEFGKLLVPLPFRGIIDTMADQGIPKGLIWQALATAGASVNTYTIREEEKQTKERGQRPKVHKPRVRPERER
jgi:hypothetical protein